MKTLLDDTQIMEKWFGVGEGENNQKIMSVVRASSEGDISCESKNSGNTSGLYSIITKRLK